MYKIFFNDKRIILTNVQDNLENTKYFPLEDISIEQIVEELSSDEVDTLYLYHPKKKKLLSKFQKKIKTIQAAGGIVVNPKNKVLFIKRKGKWDLPKGKLDPGETLAECAVREVQEETGIAELMLLSFRSVTYHIFQRNEKYYLKETHWFNMYSTSKEKFVPQVEEDIEKVKWKSQKKLAKTLENSYANIRELFNSSSV